MRLIMATSADGIVAKGPFDDMKWTGKDDKKAFRLLTSVGGTCLAGSRTFALMPTLRGRRVVSVSTRRDRGITLEEAARRHRGAWVIGGQTLALATLEADLVHEVFMCRATDVELGAEPGAVIDRITPLLPPWPVNVVQFGTCRVEVYRWRGKRGSGSGSARG